MAASLPAYERRVAELLQRRAERRALAGAAPEARADAPGPLLMLPGPAWPSFDFSALPPGECSCATSADDGACDPVAATAAAAATGGGSSGGGSGPALQRFFIAGVPVQLAAAGASAAGDGDSGDRAAVVLGPRDAASFSATSQTSRSLWDGAIVLAKWLEQELLATTPKAEAAARLQAGEAAL